MAVVFSMWVIRDRIRVAIRGRPVFRKKGLPMTDAKPPGWFREQVNQSLEASKTWPSWMKEKSMTDATEPSSKSLAYKEALKAVGNIAPQDNEPEGEL